MPPKIDSNQQKDFCHQVPWLYPTEASVGDVTREVEKSSVTFYVQSPSMYTFYVQVEKSSVTFYAFYAFSHAFYVCAFYACERRICFKGFKRYRQLSLESLSQLQAFIILFRRR